MIRIIFSTAFPQGKTLGGATLLQRSLPPLTPYVIRVRSGSSMIRIMCAKKPRGPAQIGKRLRVLCWNLGKMREIYGFAGPQHGAAGPQTRFAGPQLYDPEHGPEYPGHRQKIGCFPDPGLGTKSAPDPGCTLIRNQPGVSPDRVRIISGASSLGYACVAPGSLSPGLWRAVVQKQKVIVYVDSALVAAYGMLANAFGTTRSRVHRLGLEHGLEYARAAMEAEHAAQALSRRRKVPVSPLLAESGQAAPTLSVALTGLRRFGATLVRLNPAIDGEVLRAQLLDAASALTPPLPLSEADLDALVDELLEAAVSTLTALPGEEPSTDGSDQ